MGGKAEKGGTGEAILGKGRKGQTLFCPYWFRRPFNSPAFSYHCTALYAFTIIYQAACNCLFFRVRTESPCISAALVVRRLLLPAFFRISTLYLRVPAGYSVVSLRRLIFRGLLFPRRLFCSCFLYPIFQKRALGGPAKGVTAVPRQGQVRYVEEVEREVEV